MPRTSHEQAHTERLRRQYLDRQREVFLEIEREALGCDYGGTSWTDRAEAERIAAALEMSPGARVLELGAGSGWPGLYLARETGCGITLADLPLEGLRIAATRAEHDGVGRLCAGVNADGAHLPFAGSAFDSVYHCDVLC